MSYTCSWILISRGHYITQYITSFYQIKTFWQGNRFYCQTKQKSEKKNETKFTYSPLCGSIYELLFNIKDNDWIFPANEFWELNRISTWQQRIYRGTMLGLQVPLPHSFWAKDFFLACRNILKKDPVLKLRYWYFVLMKRSSYYPCFRNWGFAKFEGFFFFLSFSFFPCLVKIHSSVWIKGYPNWKNDVTSTCLWNIYWKFIKFSLNLTYIIRMIFWDVWNFDVSTQLSNI